VSLPLFGFGGVEGVFAAAERVLGAAERALGKGLEIEARAERRKNRIAYLFMSIYYIKGYKFGP